MFQLLYITFCLIILVYFYVYSIREIIIKENINKLKLDSYTEEKIEKIIGLKDFFKISNSKNGLLFYGNSQIGLYIYNILKSNIISKKIDKFFPKVKHIHYYNPHILTKISVYNNFLLSMLDKEEIHIFIFDNIDEMCDIHDFQNVIDYTRVLKSLDNVVTIGFICSDTIGKNYKYIEPLKKSGMFTYYDHIFL